MKNQFVLDPRTGRQSLLVPGRNSRGGIEAIARNCEVLNGSLVSCRDMEYKGLPFPDNFSDKKPCVFRPGSEAGTTGEYARIDELGTLIVHEKRILPEFVEYGWIARLIDNMFPLLDKKNELTGEEYVKGPIKNGLVIYSDAYGKDYVIVASPYHIVPSSELNYKGIFELAIVATEREFKDEKIAYVTFGQNNAGLPRKTADALSRMEYYGSNGKVSGASIIHPHFRVDSMPFMPDNLLAICNNIQAFNASCLEDVFGPYVILSNEHFIIYADPTPAYSGSLIVEARHAQNLLDIKQFGIMSEAAEMLQTAQRLIDIVYDSPPSNMHTLQVPEKLKGEYDRARMMFFIEPRLNVHAFFENNAHIPGVTEIPLQVAADMREKVLPCFVQPVNA